MKTLASLVLLAAAPGLAAAQATKEDLKKLAKAGVSEEVILTYIRANGYQGKPSSDDLVELKDAGLSDAILKSLIAPAEQPAVPPVTRSTTVYVQPSPVYASGYLSVGASYYPGSYIYPSYRRYYSGSWCRPSYYRPIYYRSSFCSPRASFSFHRSFSRSHCRTGSRVRW